MNFPAHSFGVSRSVVSTIHSLQAWRVEVVAGKSFLQVRR